MSDFRDFHMHTTYSDGRGTPEEMILSAIEKGMPAVGISDHSFTAFDVRYCMKKENEENYFNEIMRLKEKYADKIRVYVGLEQDYYSEPTTLPYDYKIGSVHYLCKNGEYMYVDSAPNVEAGAEYLHKKADELFDGDIYALAENYFENIGNVVEKTNADVVGHFDLISKFNETGLVLDENHPRYINAGTRAIDRLLKTGKPFEINTGAIAKGYKTKSYPSEFFRNYIASHGGQFIFSSDSHSPQNIGYGFDKLSELQGIQVIYLF